MNETTIQVYGLTVRCRNGELERQYEQARSELASQSLYHIRRLETAHRLLVPQTTNWNEETIFYHYTMPRQQIHSSEIQQATFVEKLRLLLACFDFRELLELRLVFTLDPQNIVFDHLGRVYVVYRSLPEWVSHTNMDERMLLRQLQCLILTLFEIESFATLYNGGLEIVNITDPFLQQVRQSEDLASLEKLVTDQFFKAKTDEANSTQRIAIKKLSFLQRAASLTGVMSALASVVLCYVLTVHAPQQQKLLRADQFFMAEQYAQVIDVLSPFAVADLPTIQKYVLAVSYVQQHDFTDEQRQKALVLLSLNEQSLYPNYWIYIGRGQFEQALDVAKRLEDHDLIVYSLHQQSKFVRNDQSLTGVQREQQLKEISDQYEAYNGTRKEFKHQSSEEVMQNRSYTGS